MGYKTTISELGDDEVYNSLQKKLEDIRQLPKAQVSWKQQDKDL